MSSKAGSTTQRAEVKRVAVVTHGRPETSGDVLARLRTVAQERGIELLLADDELEKHGVRSEDGDRHRPTSPWCWVATGRCCAHSSASSARRSP